MLVVWFEMGVESERMVVEREMTEEGGLDVDVDKKCGGRGVRIVGVVE
jgi:hypothetical protein